ncbi:MAG: carbohydrate ABC transporter permease [Desertimonas sp.]
MTVASGASAAEGTPEPRARERRRRRATTPALPYLLLAPAVIALVAMLGYPLVRLAIMSVQDYELPQVFGRPAAWVGLENYRQLLGESYFWTVLWRTIVFCAINVALTMGLGVLVALLLDALGAAMRLAVSVSLIIAWAMPALTATVVWQWLFDTEYGLFNWIFDRQGQSWLAEPLTFFMVATIIVVWMGVPFVAFTVYAGLTQIPHELTEAAMLDGAGFGDRFRYVTLPAIKPILLILVSLSVLWDLRVFTQIYVLQRAGGVTRDTNLLGVYAYRISIGENSYDVGAAVAVVMVLITIALTVPYLRSMARQEEL